MGKLKRNTDGSLEYQKTTEPRLVVRTTAELRDAFIKTCSEQDSTAAQEVRRFMRKYIAQNAQRPIDF